MLAETQLELRSRLGMVLFSLGRLADDIGMLPSPASTINSLVAGLKDPFLFVVAGEVNAGKSMLLNALFGEEFCQTSAMPSTDKIHYFRHGFTRQNKDLGPMLKELQMPRPFLQNFHVVDTPGINSVAEGHEAVTEEFLPRADAVIFVLPVTNPWGQRSWEFLHRIHQDLGKRIVLVLQQIDLRTPQEVEAVAEHVRLCTRKWLGRDLPVFMVSARKALLARTSGVDKAELLQQSAIKSLEMHLDAMLAESAGRTDRFGNTLRMGHILLNQVNQYLMEKSTKFTNFGAVLQKVAGAVQEQKTRSWEACLLSLKPLDRLLQRVGQEAPTRVDTSLSAWRQALQPPSMAAGKVAAAVWQQDARAALEGHVASVEKIMRKEFTELWKKTKGPLGQALGHAPSQSPDAALEFDSLREEHEMMLKELRSEESWGQASRLLLQRRRGRLLLSALAAGLSLALIVAGALMTWWWMLGAGILLLGLGPWLALQSQRDFVRILPLKLQECSRNDAKRVRLMADVSLQKWLQRAYQRFSVNFKPLLDRSESLRLAHDEHAKSIETVRQNLRDLGPTAPL